MARGSVVPTVRVASPVKGGVAEASVQWVPALSDNATISALAGVMPGAVVALGGGNGRMTALGVIAAVVEAIVTESVERMELRAPPPTVRTPQDLDDTVGNWMIDIFNFGPDREIWQAIWSIRTNGKSFGDVEEFGFRQTNQWAA